MSLRPVLSSFDHAKLTQLIGCGDAEVETAVLRRIRKAYATNMPLRVRAGELVPTIVHRGRNARYPREEDEAFQIIVDAVARHGQDHVICTAYTFWERFFGLLDAKRLHVPDPQLRLALRTLIEGRPLFGEMNVSGWAYYAYLHHSEVVKLGELIRADAELASAHDATDALAWLDASRDIWCWVS